MRPSRLLAITLGFILSSGCSRQPRPAAPVPPAAGAAPEPAGAATASGGTPAESPPAAPPPTLPAARLVRTAFAIEPTQRLSLSPAAEVVVDPYATFEVELSARVPDARLLLLDAREDIVPATGARELSTGTRLTLSPSAPLVPGSRYALRLDGASERELHDATATFSPLTLPILAAGTPPPPPPKAPARKKKRRH